MSTCPLCKKKTVAVQEMPTYMRRMCDCNWYGRLYKGHGVETSVWIDKWKEVNNV